MGEGGGCEEAELETPHCVRSDNLDGEGARCWLAWWHQAGLGEGGVWEEAKSETPHCVLGDIYLVRARGAG